MPFSVFSSPERRARLAVGLGLTLVAAACAEVGAPPGGPLDTTPPVLLDSRPDSLSTSVPTDAPLHLLFSERIDDSSARRALTVVPEVELGKPKVKDRVLSFYPSEGWPADSVVLWTLSVKLKDKHGVALAAPRQGAFTTASAFPVGVIAGQVTLPSGGSEETGDIYASVRAELRTPPPEGARRGDLWRWSLADAGGSFELPYLRTPSGPFDLLVFDDRNASGSRDEREPVAELDSLFLAVTDTILDVGTLELVDLEGPVALLACVADSSLADSLAVAVSFWSPASQPEARAVLADSSRCATAELVPGEAQVAAWIDIDLDGDFGPDSTGTSEPYLDPLTLELFPSRPDSVLLPAAWRTLPWAVMDTLSTPPIPRELFYEDAP